MKYYTLGYLEQEDEKLLEEDVATPQDSKRWVATRQTVQTYNKKEFQ